METSNNSMSSVNLTPIIVCKKCDPKCSTPVANCKTPVEQCTSPICRARSNIPECLATCDPPECIATCDPPDCASIDTLPECEESIADSNQATRSETGSTTPTSIHPEILQIPIKPVKEKLKRTPAQLEALKKGREKLAEKRRLAKEAAAAAATNPKQNEETDSDSESNLITGCTIV